MSFLDDILDELAKKYPAHPDRITAEEGYVDPGDIKGGGENPHQSPLIPTGDIQ